MKIINKIVKHIFLRENNDSKEIKELKDEMFSNTYCLIGSAYTLFYLFLDLLISSKTIMACIAFGCFFCIFITMFLSIKKVEKIINGNKQSLDKVKSMLKIASTLSGWFAPVLFVISIIVNFSS